MCDKDGIDLEEIVRKNREKIEKILKDQKGSFKEKADSTKEKAEDALKGILSLFLDPEIQMHFIRAGMEFLHGIEEIVKNAPMSDNMKDTVEKACEMKDKIIDAVANEMDPKSKPKDKPKDKDKDKKMKKIDVE